MASARVAGGTPVLLRSPVAILRSGLAAVAFGTLLLGASDAIAQVGLFDPSWRPGGRRVIDTPGLTASLTFIRAAGSDWMVGGGCNTAAGARGCAVRLFANGNLDKSYGDPFEQNTALSDLAGLAGGGSYFAQSDATGRVWFARSAPGAPIGIGRINATGTAATNAPLAFHYVGAIGSPSSRVSKLVIAQDGSTYVIGTADLAPNNSDFAIARLTPELQLDPTFNGGGVRTIGFDSPLVAFDSASAAAIQPDGRLLVAGTSFPGSGGITIWVVRLMIDGSLDPSFGVGGRSAVAESLGASVGAVAVDAQDRVLIAGAQEFDTGDPDGYVIRLTPEGSFDTNFGDGGGAALGFNLVPQGRDSLNAMVIQPDGKILVGGFAQRDAAGNGFFVSARINDNGVYDASFGSGGVSLGTFGPVPVDPASSDVLRDMALDDRGRLMVAGDYAFGNSRFLAVGRIVTGIMIDQLFADGFE